jgi:hypothetical protein
VPSAIAEVSFLIMTPKFSSIAAGKHKIILLQPQNKKLFSRKWRKCQEKLTFTPALAYNFWESFKASPKAWHSSNTKFTSS